MQPENQAAADPKAKWVEAKVPHHRLKQSTLDEWHKSTFGDHDFEVKVQNQRQFVRNWHLSYVCLDVVRRLFLQSAPALVHGNAVVSSLPRAILIIDLG